MDVSTNYCSVPGGQLAYSVTGKGPNLLLLPGWPFNRQTYRKILPALAEHFTCYNVDTLGLGESTWSPSTRFAFEAQAATLQAFVKQLQLPSLSLLSFDSGGLIARMLAAEIPDQIERLFLLNTEIPGHRPPFLKLYHFLFSRPIHQKIFGPLFNTRWFVQSNLALGLCFYDKKFMDKDFTTRLIKPITTDAKYWEGLCGCMRDADFSTIDRLPQTQQRIRAPITLIWGEQDSIFPASKLPDLIKTMPTFEKLHRIQQAKLLPHEEKPDEVVAAVLSVIRRQ